MKKTIVQIKKISTLSMLFASLLFTNCNRDEDAPKPENDLEVITKVKLIFTNDADPTDIVEATATDLDDAGADPLVVNDPINLKSSSNYTLTFEIKNNLTTPGDDITAEIEEEKNDHQFFFGFSPNVFFDPSDTGNISGTGSIRYDDTDDNGNPIGLQTKWTTDGTLQSNKSFRVMLKHQPDGIKTANSTSNDGETDFDLNFVLNII